MAWVRVRGWSHEFSKVGSYLLGTLGSLQPGTPVLALVPPLSTLNPRIERASAVGRGVLIRAFPPCLSSFSQGPSWGRGAPQATVRVIISAWRRAPARAGSQLRTHVQSA